jgi:hypothetical protein
MKVKKWGACALALACAMMASRAAVAQIDEGKGSAFKSKSYEIKDKGEVNIALSFAAGKEVTVTTNGEKETDVHLFVKGENFEDKDTSPGPKCRLKFTPMKAGTFKFLVKNNGPGANKVTLEVRVAE